MINISEDLNLLLKKNPNMSITTAFLILSKGDNSNEWNELQSNDVSANIPTNKPLFTTTNK